DDALTNLFTGVGAWGLLLAGLVIGLIVTIHFSPGALLVTAVSALRAANAERERLRDLVATPAPEKTRPAKPVPSSDALTRSAASFATAPAAADQKHLWDVDEVEKPEIKAPQHEPVAVAVAEEPDDKPAPVLRVVAEPEDDLPEIEWKLPSIALLDTVTARRERMADEIKRNVKIIESTLTTFGVECKVVGVNPGPAVTQFEIQPGPGVQVKRITALQNDLSLALAGYNVLPHLALPVLVESHHAAAALRWAVAEMDRRYKLFSSEGVRNIASYNDKATQKLARTLPYVVIVIDELADLMMVAAGEIEELICRIAQLARAVGIHLIIATQRPSTDIITGLIKANIPSRIAFAVGSQVDSRVI